MAFNRILVGIDGSDAAEAAADIAGDIATRYAAELLVVFVVRPEPGRKVLEGLAEYQEVEHVRLTEEEALQTLGRIVVERTEARLREAGVTRVEPIVELGDPAPTIAALAKQRGADLVVVGRRGLSDFAALVRGSVSHKISQRAPGSCLTVG